MRLIKPYCTPPSDINAGKILQNIEIAGRTCYKSGNKITGDSATEFARLLVRNGHESVLEHESVTVTFVCDRGVSHELVRHRIASFSQESTRYCNYGKESELTFIIPEWIQLEEGKTILDACVECPTSYIWYDAMRRCERAYLDLLAAGWTPQQARSVLPNSLKTEIVVTANIREWRLILKQRTSKQAHPQMREIMRPLLRYFKQILPPLFEDISDE